MDISIFITGISVAVASSLFGVFVVLRRLALVSDAISHVALPGMAIGLLYGFDPFWGALACLIAAAFIIFFLEKKTPLATETIVGILFITALAFGSILIDDEHLVEALFGSIEAVTFPWALFSLAVSFVVALGILFALKNFIRTFVSQDIAQSEGIKVSLWSIVFLVMFAIVVALGIKVVGSLLMGALVVLPAAAAKNIAHSLRGMILFSAGFGTISVITGLFISYAAGSVVPGPFIILTAVFLFIGSFMSRLVFR